MNTANPNATPEVHQMLNWFWRLPKRSDNRVVSGQHHGGNDCEAKCDEYLMAVFNDTGHWPALLGIEFGWGDWDTGGLDNVIDKWNDGIIINVTWHADNPWTGGGSSDTSMNGGDFSDLYTPGNAAYVQWHSDMDDRAGWLDTLQDAGVVVQWRPFHEMNGGGRWWGGRDQAKFINNWVHMFEYFTYTHKLNNLLWVYAPNREEDAVYADVEFYYPGSGYVDMAGLDYYITDTYNLSDWDTLGGPEIEALGHPVALTEFGPTGWLAGQCTSAALEPEVDCYDYDNLIADIKAYCPAVTFWMSWHSNWAMINQLKVEELLEDSWVITRADVNWWADTADTT